jgi:tetratricopeptide (TPR) repeat protein
MTTDAPTQQPVTLTIEQALNKAVAHHQAGELLDAEHLYRAILQMLPNPDANHNLGVLVAQMKQPTLALPYFKAALEANPNIEQFWVSYIDTLILAGRIDDARLEIEQRKQQNQNGKAIEVLAIKLEDFSGSEPDPREITKLAVLFNEGRYTEAESLAQTMTERFPLYGFGWKVLGAVFKQIGRFTDALAPMQNAVALSPNDAEAYFNLGGALQSLDKFDDATSNYRRAFEIRPNYPDAYNSLCIALYHQGRFDEAEACCRRALEINSDHSVLHNTLGNILKCLDRTAEAELSFRRSIAISPDYAEAYINLSINLHNSGKLREAESICRLSLELNPDSADVHNNLGAILHGLGRLNEAEANYRQSLQINPNSADAYNNLGVILHDLNKLNEAETSYNRSLLIKPEFADACYNLGNTLLDLGRLDDAKDCFRQALQINPTHANAHSNLGSIYLYLGWIDEAEALFKQAIQIDPKSSSALHNIGNFYLEIGQVKKAKDLYLRSLMVKPDFWKARYGLTSSDKVTRGDTNFAALNEAFEEITISETPMPNNDMIFLHFALGKCYDDIGDHEKAFQHFLAGCKLKRILSDYNPTQTTLQISRIMDDLDRATFGRLREAGNPSHLPIFILGMPRSGTTLTEQIISSHPNVYGAGEIPDLMNIIQQNTVSNVMPISFPNNLRALDQATLTAWGTEYVTGLKRRAPDAMHITDKMPTNFLALGLIHLMLPNAKIIHVNRNPVDTCLSCFTQLFTFKNNFTYDLSELGMYYGSYACLMKHWRNVLPAGAFLDVNYEDIVSDQETQTRRIIEFCGLEWNEACLEPQENMRAIHTASVTQVRQPIYSSSVARWRKYEKFLGPLLDELCDLLPKCD